MKILNCLMTFSLKRSDYSHVFVLHIIQKLIKLARSDLEFEGSKIFHDS